MLRYRDGKSLYISMSGRYVVSTYFLTLSTQPVWHQFIFHHHVGTRSAPTSSKDQWKNIERFFWRCFEGLSWLGSIWSVSSSYAFPLLRLILIVVHLLHRSKAALNHFTQTLAVEEPSITSIAVRPGVVDTSMQDLIRSQGSVPECRHIKFVRPI